MIKVLNKALDILEFAAKGEATLSAIARAIGEKPTTASNIVQTLLARDYLERCEGGYRLGMMSYVLTKNTPGYDARLSATAEPALRKLAADTGTTAVLSVLRNNRKYVIMRIDGGSLLRVSPEAFEVRNPCVTETGLLLLAHQAPAVVDAVIAENGVPPFFPDEASLRRFLDGARERGYVSAVKRELYACAAPVCAGGRVVAAVGIYTSEYRVRDAGDGDILEALLAASRELSAGAETIYHQ